MVSFDPAHSVVRRPVRSRPRVEPTDGDHLALLRLAGEAAELPVGSQERRRHVLEGLLSLVGGAGTNCFEMADTPSGLPSTSPLECFSGLAGMEATFTRYTQEGLWQTDPGPLAMLQRGVFVGQARSWVDDAAWEASDQYQQMRRPLGLDNQIYCRFANGPQHWGLGWHRARGDRPFDPRALRLIETFVTLCPSALIGPRNATASGTAATASPPPPTTPLPPTAPLPPLAPRLAGLMRALLDGMVPKEFARRQGLSLHTVYEYQKQLYRALGVSGRSELFARYGPLRKG